MEQASIVKLTAEYLRLGGGQLVKIDVAPDGKERWQHKTRAAEAFWNEHIAPLDDVRRGEIITHLPTVDHA